MTPVESRRRATKARQLREDAFGFALIVAIIALCAWAAVGPFRWPW